MNEKEKARTEVSQILWDFKNNAKATDSSFQWVDRILSLKSDSGQPLIGIIAEDQSLPKVPNIFDKAHEKALKENGWVKILK